MAIYILSLLFILGLGFIFNCNSTKKRKIVFLIISCLTLTTIAMFRTKYVGIDTLQYFRNFQYISNTAYSELHLIRYELGFTYLCKILGEFYSDPQILIIVTSIFINVSVFRFIYKNSDNVVLSVIFYILLNFYYNYMNIMRQALAISIILWGFEFIKKEKNISFIITVIIAMQFHSSAILALVFFVFKKCKFDRKFIFIVFIMSIICVLYGRKIFLLIGSISPRLYEYTGGDYDVANYFGALVNFLLYTLIFIFGMIVIKLENKNIFLDKNEKDNIFIGIIGTACIMSALVMRVSIFNRFVPYFSIFSIIWLANCISKIKKSKDRLLYSTIILLGISSYCLYIMLYRPEWYGVIPYESIFTFLS